jgi:hypothetical protein
MHRQRLNGFTAFSGSGKVLSYLMTAAAALTRN